MTRPSPFDQLLESMREAAFSVTDQQLAEMQPHEREYILTNRALLRAYDRGDNAELDRLGLEQLDRLRESLRRFT